MKTDDAELAVINVKQSAVWRDGSTAIQTVGVQELYFCYAGQSSANLLSFRFT